MSNAPMAGAAAVRKTIADYLTAAWPGYLPLLRTTWGIDPEALPDPEQVLPNPLTIDMLDRWPSICVAALRVPSVLQNDIEASGAGGYRVQYAVRVYAWVKAVKWSPIFDARDYYTAAIQNMIVLEPKLRSVDDNSLVDTNTITQEFSDIQRTRGDNFVAGGYVGFTVAVDETPPLPGLGTLNQYDVTGANTGAKDLLVYPGGRQVSYSHPADPAMD